jgi:hypothetical protein
MLINNYQFGSITIDGINYTNDVEADLERAVKIFNKEMATNKEKIIGLFHLTC